MAEANRLEKASSSMNTTIEHRILGRIEYDNEAPRVAVQRSNSAERLT
jgi:hypothetical protein